MAQPTSVTNSIIATPIDHAHYECQQQDPVLSAYVLICVGKSHQHHDYVQDY